MLNTISQSILSTCDIEPVRSTTTLDDICSQIDSQELTKMWQHPCHKTVKTISLL